MSQASRSQTGAARATWLMTVLLVAAFITTPGCRRARTPIERGQGVFLRSCAGCHGADAHGTKPPGFAISPRDLTDPEFQIRTSDAALRETIRFGKGQMPAFGAALADEDVGFLIAYVRTLSRAARTPPATVAGSAERPP